METKHKEFKPFDKVLVKIGIGISFIWVCTFYSHLNEDGCHVTICGQIFDDKDILPYECNEHLVGTIYEEDEEVKLEKGEYMYFSNNTSLSYMEIWLPRILEEINGEYDCFIAFNAYKETKIQWKYAIRFSDFNPNNMNETKKHILCVKNGKVLKYRY